MARIRLLRSGLNVADAVRVRGEEVDVERDVASYLTSSGQAELVRESTIETAVVEPGESTHRTRRRERGARNH